MSTSIRKASRLVAMLGLLVGAVAISACSISLGGHTHPENHGRSYGHGGPQGDCPHCAEMRGEGHRGHMGRHGGEPASQPAE